MRPRRKPLPAEPLAMRSVQWERSRGGVLVPRKSNLVYPLTISTGKREGLVKGTAAFVPLGTDTGEKDLLEYQRRRKRFNRARNEAKRTGQWEGIFDMGNWADKPLNRVIEARRAAANQSEYFLKLSPKRQMAIRRLLAARGILVESPIEQLAETIELRGGKTRKRFLELFSRREFKSIYVLDEYGNVKIAGVADRKGTARQMVETIVEIHAMGIVHSHPHVGNWVIDPMGRVMLIDLSLARTYKGLPKNKRDFIHRFAADISHVAVIITQLELGDNYSKVRKAGQRSPWIEALEANVQRLIDAHQSFTPTFGVKESDISEYLVRLRIRARMRKRRSKLR